MTGFSLRVLTAVFCPTLAVAAAATQVRAEDPVLTNCVVQFEDQVMLPAEEAGALVQLLVKDGQEVAAGTVLGKVDDSMALMQRDAAQAAVNAAYQRYMNEVEIKYARAAADEAKVKYERLLEANQRSPGSVSDTEIREAKLRHRTAELQIENAEKEKELARFDGLVKQAELRLAELAIERRLIKAPFEGVVVSLLRHQDEWVNPGDPILHFARLNTMRVEDDLLVSQFDPHEIRDCEVSVEVKLARDRPVETFHGRITFVSPVVKGEAGRYRVRANVANRQEFGQWMLRHGHTVKMTIHLGTGRPDVIHPSQSMTKSE